jgi:hypothetical protein
MVVVVQELLAYLLELQEPQILAAVAAAVRLQTLAAVMVEMGVLEL